MGNEFWVGFDLGGTKMMSLILDSKMNVVGRERKKTKVEQEHVIITDRILKTIRTAFENAGIGDVHIAGIGIGIPGTLDPANGTVFNAPNLAGTINDIKKIVEKEFSCPVVVCNDADAGTFGEYIMGAAKNATTALGIFCGTGIGGGMVHRGMLFIGSKSTSFEIGHIPVVPDGNICGCGRRGCLETVASRLAIASAAAMAVYRGEAPVLQQIAGTDIAAIRSGSLAAAIKGGDIAIEKIVIAAAHQLGRVVAGLVNTVTPDIIVLGGGLVEAMPVIYITQVKEAIKNHSMGFFKPLVTVAPARLGDDATAIGAAAWARKIIRGI